MKPTALTLMLISALVAGPAFADSAGVDPRPTAVLAVDLGGAGAASSSVADALRDRLALGGQVLSREETVGRLRSLGVGVGFGLASLVARVEAAERAQEALDTGRSIEILEGVLQDLENDADFTRAKQELRELARVRTATRLLALAGAEADGGATTELGLRARAHLVAAARVNPALTLSDQDHPPRMRRLLEGAHSDVKRAGLGGLYVESVPAGATVVMEGRPVGLTPLRLLEQIPRGSYRVWLEREDARSVTRRIEIGADPVRLEVDLGFEGALWRDGPGLRPGADENLEADVAAQVGALVAVERLLLAGLQGHVAFAAVVDVASGTVERRVATSIAGELATDAEVDALWARLAGGPEGANEPVPSRLLPTGAVHAASAPPEAREDDEDGVGLWLAVGGVGAGVVLATLLTAGVVAVALSTAPAGRFDVEIVP